MLPNELPVVISGSTHYYTLESLNEGRSTRRDIGEQNLALPKLLTVSRNSSGKGNKAVDSYLMRLDSTIASETDANSYVQSTTTLSTYFVVKVPRGMANGKVTAAQQADALRSLLAQSVAGSTSSVLARWLNGEL